MSDHDSDGDIFRHELLESDSSDYSDIDSISVSDSDTDLVSTDRSSSDDSDGDSSGASFISTELLNPSERSVETSFANDEDAEAFRGVWQHHYEQTILPLKGGNLLFFNYTFHGFLGDAGKRRLAKFFANAKNAVQVNVTLTEQQPQSLGLVFRGPFQQDRALQTFKMHFRHHDDGVTKANIPLDDWSCISQYLGDSSSLRHLELGCWSLGRGELEQLASALKEVKLKTLGFFNLDVSREDDSSLGNLFSSMNSERLESIDLVACNAGVGTCEGLARILRTEQSKVECLGLRGNPVDDDCVRVLCSSLAKNKALSMLQLQDMDTITDEGWNMFGKLVSDTTSLESLYKSNHTLRDVPGHPRSENTFRCNVRWTSGRRGREKILDLLTNHGQVDFNIGLLTNFKVEMMPYIIEFFGKLKVHYNESEIFFCVYQIIRRWNMPELFSFPSAEKVRSSARTNELKKQNRDLRRELEQAREEILRLKSENSNLKSNQNNSKRIRFN